MSTAGEDLLAMTDQEPMAAPVTGSYEILVQLLRSQRKALGEGAFSKLPALASQIEIHSSKLSQAGPDIATMDRSQREELRKQVKRLLQEVRRNQHTWQEYRHLLEKQREDLSSARRFAQAVRGSERKLPRVRHQV